MCCADQLKGPKRVHHHLLLRWADWTKGFSWTEFGFFCIDFRSITDFGARA